MDEANEAEPRPTDGREERKTSELSALYEARRALRAAQAEVDAEAAAEVPEPRDSEPEPARAVKDSSERAEEGEEGNPRVVPPKGDSVSEDARPAAAPPAPVSVPAQRGEPVRRPAPGNPYATPAAPGRPAPASGYAGPRPGPSTGAPSGYAGPNRPQPQGPQPEGPQPQGPGGPPGNGNGQGPWTQAGGAQQPQPQPQWQRYDPWNAPQTMGPAAPPRRRGRALVGALLIAVIAGGTGGGLGSYLERNGSLGGDTTLDQPSSGDDGGERAPDSVAGIAKAALPGVVTLHVSGGGEQATGTGFVLDKKGHILTNNHVVAGAASGDGQIRITFSGGETASAEIVGRDTGYDLAVVKVKGVSNLSPLPLGNSDSVQVGDQVVAIGAPYDLANTVTSGIISAKERPITAGGEEDSSDVSYVDALQTDAPINPGNSGGPLMDRKGRVIGINSAIRGADNGSGESAGSGGSIGLGFAIPVNQGKRVAEELINTGKASHPVIGVVLDMQYTGDGARVGDDGEKPAVTPGGPADDAGIQPGDVITEVDGKRVHNGEELIVKVRSHRPQDKLKLTVERDGDEREITITLGSAST